VVREEHAEGGVKLEVVAFSQQIAIPGTGRRELQFHAADGWDIEEREGVVHLQHPSGHDFFTDGVMSWKPMPLVVTEEASAYGPGNPLKPLRKGRR
jgi:hypothetical protein